MKKPGYTSSWNYAKRKRTESSPSGKKSVSHRKNLKLLGGGKLILQPPTVKKVTKKPKESKKTVVVEEDDDDSGEANKENIDPNRKYGGSNIWAFCWLL